MLSFLVNSKDYYHKHGIENFFHDHDYDHVLVHIHDSRMMLHSLQGMAQIQLDETGGSTLITHYFVRQQKDMKLIQIVW